MTICPNCQEVLKPDAVQCSHCGHQLAPIPAVAKSGGRPTPDGQKFGCAILIVALVALVLWAFTSRYLSESPEGAEAVKTGASGGAQQDRQGR